MTDERLLEEQLACHRARAREYDEWWERRSRHDRGEEANAQWRSEVLVVREVFDTRPLFYEAEHLETAARVAGYDLEAQ